MLPCSHSELVSTHKQYLLSPILHIQKSSKQYKMYTVSGDQSCVILFLCFWSTLQDWAWKDKSDQNNSKALVVKLRVSFIKTETFKSHLLYNYGEAAYWVNFGYLGYIENMTGTLQADMSDGLLDSDHEKHSPLNVFILRKLYCSVLASGGLYWVSTNFYASTSTNINREIWMNTSDKYLIWDVKFKIMIFLNL